MKKKYLCNLNYLTENKSLIKYFEDLKDELILFRDEEGIIQCFSSVCPHLAGEIRYKNNQLSCRWHGLKFNKKGESINGKVKLCLNKYKVEVIDNKIYVQEI